MFLLMCKGWCESKWRMRFLSVGFRNSLVRNLRDSSIYTVVSRKFTSEIELSKVNLMDGCSVFAVCWNSTRESMDPVHMKKMSSMNLFQMDMC